MNIINQCATPLVLCVFVVHAAATCAAAQTSRFVLRSDGVKKTMRLRVFFTNPNSPDFATTCAAGEFVYRIVPRARDVANKSLRLVFAGPTAQEKAKGMSSPTELGCFYRGVSIKNGVAIVNFRPGAQKHLQVSGPVCMTEKALTPMKKTLLQFKTIKSVKYAINGRIITEWDA